MGLYDVPGVTVTTPPLVGPVTFVAAFSFGIMSTFTSLGPCTVVCHTPGTPVKVEGVMDCIIRLMEQHKVEIKVVWVGLL